MVFRFCLMLVLEVCIGTRTLLDPSQDFLQERAEFVKRSAAMNGMDQSFCINRWD